MSVGGMLARVRRIEAERAAPLSKIEIWYGSFTAFRAAVEVKISAGMFDSVEMPLVLAALHRWHSER